MALLDLATASRPFWTSSAIVATGATTLVSAPPAGYAIAVQTVRVWGQTNTTGQVQGSFLDGGATLSRLWHVGISLGTAFIDKDLTAAPWLLNTASALQYACTVSASSTPGLFVEVCCQIVKVG